VERSRVNSSVAFESKDQRNTKFGGPVSDRLLIGAQNICKPLEADTGERLLPDQLIVCRREILSSMCVIHPAHMNLASVS
jgi:hypothetical protein